ncbi:hypothetical protein [Streptomyces sp. ATMOS53]
MNLRTIPDDRVQVPRRGGRWASLVEAALDPRTIGTNFAPSHAERIMSRSKELPSPGGTLINFGYLRARQGGTLTALRAGRYRGAAVDDVLADYRRIYATGRWAVWANLPPADAWQLQRSCLPVALSPGGGVR